MKKIICTLFFVIVTTTSVFSQVICVYDADSNEPVPYATVIFSNHNKWNYTDYKGCFIIPVNSQLEDSIQIKLMGYEEFSATVANLPKEIFLRAIPILLNEAIITPKKTNYITLGYTKEKTSSIDHSTFSNFQFIINAIYIPNNNRTTCTIHKLIYPYEVKKGDNFSFVVRPQLYTVGNDGLPDKPLLNNAMLYSTIDLTKRKGQFEVVCADENIYFPEEGVFVALELLDIKDEKGNSVRSIKENNFQNIRMPFLMMDSKKKQVHSYTLISQDLKWYNSIQLLNFAFGIELNCDE